MLDTLGDPICNQKPIVRLTQQPKLNPNQ